MQKTIEDIKMTKESNKESFILGNIFFLGLLLVLGIWIFDIFYNEYKLSISAIIKIHNNNPAYLLIDTIPFVFLALSYFINKSKEIEIQKLKIKLAEKEDKISKSAHFAKLIGEGNLNADTEDVDKDDILTQALMRMRDNLLKTSKKESEQSWIASGRDEIGNILRLHNNLEELAYETIKSLIEYINAIQGAFYFYNEETRILKNIASYAYNRRKYINQEFAVGVGLIGQSAYEMATIYRTEIPDNYVTISSGILGETKPKSILIVPLISDEKLQGIIEFASIDDEIPELKIKFLEQLSSIIAQTVFNLKVNARTEALLQDSQKMTEELKENEEELKQNAEEMKATHDELERSNSNLEAQIKEVENAQKKMHSLLENASEIIAIYNKDRKLTYMSPSVVNILGYTTEEMMEGKDIDRLTTKGQKEIALLFEQLMQNPSKPVTIQYTYLRKDNQKIYIEAIGRNFLNDPAINGIILNSQDITARKKAEIEERMKSKMQALSENSVDMITRIGVQGKFFYLNPIFEKMTGIPVSSAINKELHEINLAKEVVDVYNNVINQIKKTVEKCNFEAEFPSATGENRIMAIVAIPEFSEDKELETILVVAHDITDQKRIEREIIEKNHAITESINYAYRIQTAILPDNKVIKEYLPNSFMFYKPRDVVSGDFPWFFTKGDDIFIAAVDCTGHGVPGALLSFIGYFLLNNIADHLSDSTAGKICDSLHEGVRKTLRQDKDDANARDGMDIAFCKINFNKMELQYAGAHRPLYLLKNDELIEYKGNRKAIGGIPHAKKTEIDFENYIIKLEKGDKFFFFSDGFPDQVGGPDRRKYQSKKVKELIMNNKNLNMPSFNSLFKKEFIQWKGEEKQIDDVLLIGIEI
jgi:PAS domain S-box-containing protein